MVEQHNKMGDDTAVASDEAGDHAAHDDAVDRGERLPAVAQVRAGGAAHNVISNSAAHAKTKLNGAEASPSPPLR